MKRIRQIIIGLALMLNVGLLVTPVMASAATTAKQSACQALTNNNTCAQPTGSLTLNKIVRVILNVLSVIVGLVAVIMIIVGGLKYITSGGDSNSVTSAKNTILYALIGLVVVATAQFIVGFVLNKVK